MFKDISERKMSCLLPEPAWLSNNTNCKLSRNIPRAEGSLKTNQH
jgi:hypothetical protein